MNEIFGDYLEGLPEDGRRVLGEVLTWVLETYPDLTGQIKWNQPMFTHHGTFIIGFSGASKHFSVAPEHLDDFIDRVKQIGYSHGKKLVRIRYDEPVNYPLLSAIIEETIERKRDITTFWTH